MKAIILAAGRGTRISRMIDDVPKSTLSINGEPLIRRTVKMLASHDIQIVVCTGYQDQKIKEALAGLPVIYYYNPFFDITNSLASLWLARKELSDEDTIIMNADVFLCHDILKMILDNRDENVMAIDKTRTAVGDYFFKTLDNDCIAKYGKDLPLAERTGEYVGIAKLSSRFVSHFRERMEEMIRVQKHNCWWENVMYSFADGGEKDIHTMDVNGLFWAEIDYFDDYERILSYVKKTEEK